MRQFYIGKLGYTYSRRAILGDAARGLRCEDRGVGAGVRGRAGGEREGERGPGGRYNEGS